MYISIKELTNYILLKLVLVIEAKRPLKLGLKTLTFYLYANYRTIREGSQFKAKVIRKEQR